MGFALSEMQLRSPTFAEGAAIPIRCSAYGDNISPAIEWTDPPAAARSFALFVHDPDAPLVSPDGTYGYVHWVLYNIAGSATHLDEGSTGGCTTGLNQNGDATYFGPRPPEGHGEHHYFFSLLALGREPDLRAGLDLWALLEQVEPDVLAMNRMMGTYVQPRAT
jgi:hypothetical protein